MKRINVNEKVVPSVANLTSVNVFFFISYGQCEDLKCLQILNITKFMTSRNADFR